MSVTYMLYSEKLDKYYVVSRTEDLCKLGQRRNNKSFLIFYAAERTIDDSLHRALRLALNKLATGDAIER